MPPFREPMSTLLSRLSVDYKSYICFSNARSSWGSIAKCCSLISRRGLAFLGFKNLGVDSKTHAWSIPNLKQGRTNQQH